MYFKAHGPAYRIKTQRLVIKFWDPIYAKELKAAVDNSLDSLLPWMPWAKNEPQDYSKKIELLRTFRGDFDLNKDFVYGIFDSSEDQVIGGTGLHTMHGPLALEIGYWINKEYQSKGFATEAAAALIKAGFELSDIDRIEIRCDVKNIASIKVIEKLGLKEKAVLERIQKDANDKFQDIAVYMIFRGEYEKSSFKEQNIKFYNAMGEEISL
jgi:RimJ/RimL family protein N-acetyltransferase